MEPATSSGPGPGPYAGEVEAPQELPDVAQNAALLDFLRGQASPPRGPDDYTLGAWQLHTPPDLIAELRKLAPGWPLTAAYGVPLLANEGIAAVAAASARTGWPYDYLISSVGGNQRGSA